LFCSAAGIQAQMITRRFTLLSLVRGMNLSIDNGKND